MRRGEKNLTPVPWVDQQPDGAVHDWTDARGNLKTGGLSPNREDTLYDSAGNDHIISGGGSDLIYATRGGDDLIEAGAGRDIVFGGDGADVILGGSGGDILDGGAGDDRIYAGSQIDAATAIASGNANASLNAQGDWLSEGEGDEGVGQVTGSSANDSEWRAAA